MNEREIFTEALERGSLQERRAYLDAACGENALLRSRIELLLKSHESAGSLLDHPALGNAPTEAVIGDTDGLHTGPADEVNSLGFLQPPENSQHLGRLGQYEILELVGRGGMGLVFKAQDTRLHRIVALKVLLPELAANPTARKRFLREARAAAAVSHDHVVTTYAVEECEAADSPTAVLPYLAMEFIDGQSLQQKIDRQGSIELREILRIGMQVASGLAAAHAQGLIHRDVKPSNILLQNGVERVQITDFGLARAADDAAVTRTGEVAGTPQYMSPEQAQGLAVDARSDLFSLGCVLYAMCTGRSPFRAETTMASLHRVCNDTPRPIREVNSEIPEWLAHVVDRLLEKNREDRFQTAGEVEAVLGEYLAHVQNPGSSPPGRVKLAKPVPKPANDRRPRWIVAATILLALAAALGVSEATGVTRVSGTVIRIVTGEGTLVIEVDDPSIEVSVHGEGEELTITGAGLKEIKLRPGKYKFQAIKDGEPLKTELISITRGDRQIVRVTREMDGGQATADSEVEKGAFVVLSGEGAEVAKFDTLADAVLGSSAGDTIEIRGDGPFMTDGIIINHPLVIRAARGFRPLIHNEPALRLSWDKPLFKAKSRLVVEGLDLQHSHSGNAEPLGYLVTSFAPLYMANCRLFANGRCIHAATSGRLKNCELIAAKLSETVEWKWSSGEQFTIENCLNVGQLNLYRWNDSPFSLRLSRNTMIKPGRNILLLSLFREPESPLEEQSIQIETSENILDSPGPVFYFSQSPELQRTFEPAEAEAMILQLAGWSESRNVYRSPNGLLGMGIHTKGVLPTNRGKDLSDWNAYWSVRNTGSVQGELRYQGGDLRAQALAAAGKLNPDDFRLRPDSAGYRAGADGKDLGADVDLVGPGEAYERWKATPDYEQWQEETRRLIAGAVRQEKQPFVVLSGEGAEVAKFDTLAEAVLGSSAGDTIEIRGNGPFISARIDISHALTIRAADGFHPRLQTQTDQPSEDVGRLLTTAHPLVLEGLELTNLGKRPNEFAYFVWSRGPLFVFNCRIESGDNRDGLHASADAVVMNSMIIADGGATLGYWPIDSRATLDVRNCILIGRTNVSPGKPDTQAAASAHFSRCTFLSPSATVLGVCLADCWGIPNRTDDTWLELVVRDSIFDSRQLLFDTVYRDDVMHKAFVAESAPAQFKAWLPRSGSHNLFRSGVDLLVVKRSMSPHAVYRLDGAAGLKGWNRLWGNTERNSAIGTIRYAGGDLPQRAKQNFRELQPADFRLRPDSAGYQTGRDGKDLGVDVDLVGPGEAYKRWKQTPEYAEWRDEVARLMAGASANDATGNAGAKNESEPAGEN